ncbi:MAG: uracil-DNA glycosylase [Bacillota bacterium]|nr:MAG: uracil-DNA glycosylase [Bacillota bacterium]
MKPLGNDWDEILCEDFKTPSYLKLREFLKSEYSTRRIFPPMNDIFNCFRLTPFAAVKAVILGQDPYHNPNQAMGLSFSVPDGVQPPPSLLNMYKELQDELGIPPAAGGNLTKWAKRGVLLLNTALTVRAYSANSHRGQGWEVFTDSVIKKLSDGRENLVFLLWGGNARSKKSLIDGKKHLILECAHPSPLSAYAGFFGCGHFKKCNEYLAAHNIAPIDWNLNDAEASAKGEI